MNPSWDFTVTTNLAGRNELSGNDGPALDLEQLNDQMIIYMRDAVYSMQYIGGNFVFSFRKVFDDDGIINESALASFSGGHLVVGNDDIYLTDGTTKRSLSDGRVTNYFYDSLPILCQGAMRHERVTRYGSPTRPPISSLYRLPTMNRALVYNYQYDAWTQADLSTTSLSAIGPRFRDLGTMGR